MAQKSRAKFEKRQKEQARQDRQRLKRERRAAARERKRNDVPEAETPGAPGESASSPSPSDEPRLAGGPVTK